MEEWRVILYPIGFLAGIAFGLRFLVQWFASERLHKSVVPRSFWYLSLIGNCLLLVHSFIQMQYPISLVQGLNGVIAWRNLDLMHPGKKSLSLKGVFFLFFLTTFLITAGFELQSLFSTQHEHWFRVPIAPWENAKLVTVSFFWHAIGALGYLLFAARFWIQWWMSEKHSQSELPAIFWQLSLAGALVSIAYFAKIGDSVNLIGPVVGLVPYVRNLILIQKTTLEGKR